ncbi:MAG: hypothetical protein KBC84_04555 [Proteobacteria bacterium]|nr:hypothetical protein [Pseudomonadota bacterium]
MTESISYSRRIINFEKGKKISLFSPAKLNLTLDILDRQKDGYHLLNSIISVIDLKDIVTIEKTENLGEITVITELMPELESHVTEIAKLDPTVLEVNSNLSSNKNFAYKAVSSVLERFFPQKNFGLKINIKKIIPFSAGLGGGSSNAATTLLGLVSLLGLNCSDLELIELAKDLGSDVPALLYDVPVYLCGKGEKIYPLKYSSNGSAQFLILKPLFGVETKLAYQSLNREIKDQIFRDDIHGILSESSLNTLKKFGFSLENISVSQEYPDNMLTLLQESGISSIPNGSSFETDYFNFSNNFQNYLDKFSPDIRRIENELGNFDVAKVLLAGSGSSLAIFPKSQDDLERLEQEIGKKFKSYFLKRVRFGLSQ